MKKGPIKSRSEFDAIHTCAQDRDAWKQLTSDVVAKFIEYQKAKALKLTEARKAKAKDCSVDFHQPLFRLVLRCVYLS